MRLAAGRCKATASQITVPCAPSTAASGHATSAAVVAVTAALSTNSADLAVCFLTTAAKVGGAAGAYDEQDARLAAKIYDTLDTAPSESTSTAAAV
jgi:hypothetical protein